MADHAGEAHLLPGEDVVGLAGGLHSLSVQLQAHQSDGQLGVVADVSVADAGRLVQLLVEQDVGHVLHASDVAGSEEVLEVGQTVGLGVGVDDLVVDLHVLHLDSRHLEVQDQVLVHLSAAGRLDDVHEGGGVVGLDERADGLLHHVLGQLSAGEDGPHVGLVPVVGELHSALHRVDVLQQHLDGLRTLCLSHQETRTAQRTVSNASWIKRKMIARLKVCGMVWCEVKDVCVLLVNEEGLLVQLILVADGDLGDIRSVVVVESLDVVHHSLLVSLDGGEDEQVLQVAVGGELSVRGSVQDDALQQLDELVGQVGGHEGLDGGGHLLWQAGLGQCSGDHLVDELTAELVLLR